MSDDLPHINIVHSTVIPIHLIIRQSGMLIIALGVSLTTGGHMWTGVEIFKSKGKDSNKSIV